MDEDRSTLYCRKCGVELGQKVSFCPKCGTERSSNGVVYRKVTDVNWGSREVAAVGLGGVLILAGLMPFFFIDTSVIGVTRLVRLASSAGILSVAFGFTVILFGTVVPWVRTVLT